MRARPYLRLHVGAAVRVVALVVAPLLHQAPARLRLVLTLLLVSRRGRRAAARRSLADESGEASSISLSIVGGGKLLCGFRDEFAQEVALSGSVLDETPRLLARRLRACERRELR